MYPPRAFLVLMAIGFLLTSGVGRLAAEDNLKAGAKLDALPVGPTTYTQVQVRSVNTRTLMITHAGGMASIRLRDLSPEWQARFGYDPAAEAASEETLRKSPARTGPLPTAKPASQGRQMHLDGLLQSFGHPAKVLPEVDMKQTFIQLELGVKNQGRRPSCSIFAVVSALEFENAELTGHVEKFSEEYLIWATRKTVQRTPVDPATLAGVPHDLDEGFTLTEVVSALRAYGIPAQSSMPNTFGSKIESIEDPPPTIIREARSQQRVFVHQLPGRDNATRINNLVLALNAQLPIVVGLDWPNYHSLRNAFLDNQTPMVGVGHAVTLVGYKNTTGRIEDTLFMFKNSWGVNWGQGGYGVVTYRYLSSYLNDAVLLEVFAG